jgi:transcription initiation factor TFIID TATA-box-binding protein|tara:strand:- start:18876 stop:19424 length:549 start_codon:yes stop_codon:yes gene_type:complete
MPREVVNMVASTQYCRSLDINDIADTLEIEYEQEQFPGMVYRVTTPKVCLLLFRSGKAVATGARSAEDVESAFRQLHEVLQENEFLEEDNNFKPEDIEISNLVITHDYGTPVDLNTLIISLPFDKCEYEPEQFPGLIYRLDSPKAVCLIFSSGKCVITGTRSVVDSNRAADLMDADLKEVLS